MRRVLLSAGIVLVLGAFIVIAGGFESGPSNPTYKLEFDNAFGLVTGAPFKVAGVPAGSITSINLCYTDKHAHCQNSLDALVTVQVTSKGFGAFRSDASCQSRPQSLIGEYFVDCEPGQYGKPLASGSTLGASHTFSTIPADLLADIMRMPERERFTLIINELGAAVAGRSTDLQTALQRAVPALDETDNLLSLLGNDSQTLKALTASSNSVITALANNSTEVQDFIVDADKAATDTATQQANLKTTLARFPGFLEQLKPAMAKLSSAATANTPVLANLNAASGQLHTLFTNLASCSQPHTGNDCGFANASLPALKSLGQASITGKQAVQTAAPTVSILNKFAAPASQGGAGTGELAQNLAIVLPRPGHPGQRGRARLTQPGRQGLQWSRGAAPVRVQPDARDQHVRTFRSHARGRRVREPDVHAVRDAGDDLGKPKAVWRRIPAVLLVARAEPAGRQRDRPVGPERLRPRPRWRAPGRDRTLDHCVQVPGRGAQHEPSQEALQELEHAGAVDLGHDQRDGLAARRLKTPPGHAQRPGRARGGQQRDRRRHRTARRSRPRRSRACLLPTPAAEQHEHTEQRRAVGPAGPAAPQLPPVAMKRKQQSAFANPVLIGAVTVLVLLVAVFLAYNANEGLPFVPTRELKVDIANGSELVAGNDVREGGYLIGLVSR